MSDRPHPFETGEAYANRKGVYEVLEIDASARRMRVRYLEGGETAVLTIDTQQTEHATLLARMERLESELESVRAGANL